MEPTRQPRPGASSLQDAYLTNLRDCGLFTDTEWQRLLTEVSPGPGQDSAPLARRLVEAGKLTEYQVDAVRERRFNELVIGNYEILDRLGAGGMGTVYKARHRRMKRVVAVKVLARNVAQSPTFVQRFQREVEAVARLSHPNIVMAHDADEAEAGHFLVMEFVDGRDLATEVQREGPLPVQEAVHCILQAARALEYAHGEGIVHRDIKPANLIRDFRGVVKVADLGLARLAGVGEAGGAITQAGGIVGTVDFMPPEQALDSTTVDHRVDIYSLGCTLYFILTGQPPYRGDTLMATLLQHRDAPIPSVRKHAPDVPDELDAVVRRMMAKKPEDRFPTMADVARALESIEVPEADASKRPTGPRPEVVIAATVDLPPDTATGTADKAPAAEAPPRAGSAVVLLVEPSRTQAMIIRKYLEQLDRPEVEAISSGQKALEAIRTLQPRVVISALHLPDMTGAELVRQMRAGPPGPKPGVVLISSQSDTEVACEGKVVWLRKPFDLPRLAEAIAEAERASIVSAPPPRAEMRVLLVDDSAAARVNGRRVLTELGFRKIDEATDGAQAVALISRHEYDLVVTDYNMPYMDGSSLVGFIRKQCSRPNVPIIMVTTETDPGKLDAARRQGVSAICDKRFPVQEARAIVARLLGDQG